MAALPLTTTDGTLDDSPASRLSVLSSLVGRLKENAAQTFSEVGALKHPLSFAEYWPL